jgi:Lrp/AsnC family transcriptional regulator
MDLIDRKIIATLQADATLSIQQIADRVGLSQTPCWKRIQRRDQRRLRLDPAGAAIATQRPGPYVALAPGQRPPTGSRSPH